MDRIFVQVTIIYRRLRIGRDDHLDQSEALRYIELVHLYRNTGHVILLSGRRRCSIVGELQDIGQKKPVYYIVAGSAIVSIQLTIAGCDSQTSLYIISWSITYFCTRNWTGTLEAKTRVQICKSAHSEDIQHGNACGYTNMSTIWLFRAYCCGPRRPEF